MFRKLDEADAAFLEADFSMQVIKQAVWSCAGNKAPGSDGFNYNFIKKYWAIIKTDFSKCILHFATSGSLARGCNASTISLIPKNSDPLVLNDYRLISLIGCIYKVISKLLSFRLAKFIHKLISQNQTAFISGRQILDDSLIANELVNYAQKVNINFFCLRLILKKLLIE